MSEVKAAFESSHNVGDESGGSLLGHIWASIGATLVLGVICCGIYPLIVYGIGQTFFPHQANGSLVTKDGTPTTDDSKAVGSSLIGQRFSAPGYFHPRPSAANNGAGSSYTVGGGYDATSSGGTNYGPLSDVLINGLTAAATPPATQPDTQPATQTAAATASAPATVTTASTAASTQPAETLAFDGIRLRVIHYCLDNGINFTLYHVKYDNQGDIITGSRRELMPDEKLKFIDAQGNVNDVALVDAFPHMDMSGKEAVIADDFATLIPADAVTASGSGLDPHISPANAALQAQRVADARKLSKEKVLELISQNTDRPNLGILGDAGVNVLMLNIALDKAAPMPASAPATTPATAPEAAPAGK